MAVTERKPPWLRRRIPSAGRNAAVMAAIHKWDLHTVCEKAHCPNQMECYSRGTATFLLLGPDCTRHCTFCAVGKSRVYPPDPYEPARIAQAVSQMRLSFCVFTMVTRDDLPDGGAGHIVQTVKALKEAIPDVGLELLISDLGGNWPALGAVLASGPQVINHNLETVPRLYPQVRPEADYQRSLELLSRSAAHTPPVVTKSGLMLGLGETKEEVIKTMGDLREAGCQLLTLGQYLRPSVQHHPVVRYITPEEFNEYKAEALALGFSGVASGPLVRSSYQAAQLFRTAAVPVSPVSISIGK